MQKHNQQLKRSPPSSKCCFSTLLDRLINRVLVKRWLVLPLKWLYIQKSQLDLTSSFVILGGAYPPAELFYVSIQSESVT